MDLRYVAGFFDGEGSIGIYRALSKIDRHPVRFHLKTQLTQNKASRSEELLRGLMIHYGGNLTEQRTLSGKIKFNWQLNSESAVRFLDDILPFLFLKHEQAEVAIAWQRQRPPLVRNALGHIQRKIPEDVSCDEKVSELVKALKKATLSETMLRHPEFLAVMTRLNLLRVEQGGSEYAVAGGMLALQHAVCVENMRACSLRQDSSKSCLR